MCVSLSCSRGSLLCLTSQYFTRLTMSVVFDMVRSFKEVFFFFFFFFFFFKSIIIIMFLIFRDFVHWHQWLVNMVPDCKTFSNLVHATTLINMYRLLFNIDLLYFFFFFPSIKSYVYWLNTV
jgi:hypothetical protein